MVQICIKVNDPTSKIPEWAMIELQGDLESKTNLPLHGAFVGDLHFTKQGIPILIIGHHILYGKIQDLEKPLLVLKKTKLSCNVRKLGENQEVLDDDDDETQADLDEDATQAGLDCGEAMDTSYSAANCDKTDYQINAVIKKKLIFKARPKPIIANVPKKV